MMRVLAASAPRMYKSVPAGSDPAETGVAVCVLETTVRFVFGDAVLIPRRILVLSQKNLLLF